MKSRNKTREDNSSDALSYLQWTDDKFALKMGVQVDEYKAYAAHLTAVLDAQVPPKTRGAGGGSASTQKEQQGGSGGGSPPPSNYVLL